MGVKIWFKAEGCKPEAIDIAKDYRTAGYLFHEYALAFGVLPGQPRHGKDKLWIGLKRNEPSSSSR